MDRGVLRYEIVSDKLVKLNFEYVAMCGCGSQTFYMKVDQIEYTKILGMECTGCGEFVEVEILK
jgi:hypothetical protein